MGILTSSLLSVRELFSLEGHLDVNTSDFYVNVIGKPVILTNRDNNVCVEIGLLVCGRISIFNDIAARANEIIAKCEAIIESKRYGDVKSLALHNAFKGGDKRKPTLCISIKTSDYSLIEYVDSLDDVHNALYRRLGIPSPH